ATHIIQSIAVSAVSDPRCRAVVVHRVGAGEGLIRRELRAVGNGLGGERSVLALAGRRGVAAILVHPIAQWPAACSSKWIIAGAVDARLKMQMQSAGASRGAHTADLRAAGDGRANRYVDGGIDVHVEIPRGPSTAVIEFDVVSTAT